jgi:hypothetical protein
LIRRVIDEEIELYDILLGASMFFLSFLRSYVKLLVSECKATFAYARRAKQAIKKRQRRALLVLHELPSLP